jgi:hypothetical protein
VQSSQFSFDWACGSSILRLVGTFCGVDVAIDHLEIWQAPKIKQLRPGHIPIFPPYPKQRNAVVNLSALP